MSACPDRSVPGASPSVPCRRTIGPKTCVWRTCAGVATLPTPVVGSRLTTPIKVLLDLTPCKSMVTVVQGTVQVLGKVYLWLISCDTAAGRVHLFLRPPPTNTDFLGNLNLTDFKESEPPMRHRRDGA